MEGRIGVGGTGQRTNAAVGDKVRTLRAAWSCNPTVSGERFILTVQEDQKSYHNQWRKTKYVWKGPCFIVVGVQSENPVRMLKHSGSM